MMFNVDMKRFLSEVKTIPAPDMLIDINEYMIDSQSDHVPDSFTSFAMSTVEHISSNGNVLYGGIIHIDGWDVGRPAKRRMTHKNRKALKDSTFKSMQTQAEGVFEQLLITDPDKESGWAVMIRIDEPTTQRNTKILKTMCLFLIDIDGRVVMFDPLGSRSQVKVVSRFAFLALESAYKSVVPSHPVTGVIDTSMFVMGPGEYQSSIWCIYIAFHVANQTIDRLIQLSPEGIVSDYDDFKTLLPQHIAAAIIILTRHTTQLLTEIN